MTAHPKDTRFAYVAYDDESKAQAEKFQQLAYRYQEAIYELGQSRECALALTKLEELHMWVGKAIKTRQETKNAN